MHWPFCSCDACQRREQQLPSGFFCKPCTLPLFWDSTYPKHANEYFVTLPLRVPLWFFWSAWRLVANDLLACTLSDYFMTSCLSSSLTFLMIQKSSLTQSTATGAPCSEAHTASSAGTSGVHGLGRFFPIKLTVMLPGWITIPTSCLACGTTFHPCVIWQHHPWMQTYQGVNSCKRRKQNITCCHDLIKLVPPYKQTVMYMYKIRFTEVLILMWG